MTWKDGGDGDDVSFLIDLLIFAMERISRLLSINLDLVNCETCPILHSKNFLGDESLLTQY